MNRVTTLIILLSLLCSVGTAAVHAGDRVVVQLDDTARHEWKQSNVLPAPIRALDLPDATLRQLFRPPTAPARLDVYQQLNMSRHFELEYDVPAAAVSAEQIVNAINSVDSPVHAELAPLHHAAILPNDWGNYEQWGLEQIEMPAGWDYQADGSGVMICTIDTGCDIFHADLEDNMFVNPGEDIDNDGQFTIWDLNDIDDDNNGFVDDVTGFDFVNVPPPADTVAADGEEYQVRDPFVYPDINGHGTHVMGTAGGATDNGIGLTSASWNATALPLRAGYAYEGTDNQGNMVLKGGGSSVDFAEAIYYASNMGADIISISFGSKTPSAFYEDAVDFAYLNGTLILASAMNEGWYVKYYPAAYENVLAVGATGPGDEIAWFSNFGNWIDIMAPGVDIWSTMSNNNYHPVNYAARSGTSMATPMTAALAGLMLAHDPALTVFDLERMLKSSAENIDAVNPAFEGQMGAGRINARRALRWANSGDNEHPPVWNFIGDIGNDGVVTLTWVGDDFMPNDFVAFRVYRDGQLVAATTEEAFQDAPPLPGREYSYRVNVAYESGASAPTEPVEIYYRDPANDVLIQDFDDGLGVWTVEQSNPDYTWAWRILQPAVYATPFMVVAPSGDTPSQEFDESLISPTFSFDALGEAKLVLSHTFNSAFESPDQGHVDLSVNGGLTWETVQVYDTSSYLMVDDIDLDGYAGLDNLQLRFRYFADNVEADWWAVDEVIVQGRPLDLIDLELEAFDTYAPSYGGWVNFGIDITNTTGFLYPDLDIWTYVTGPDEFESGLLIDATIDLGPGETVSAESIGITVPHWLADGTYTYWIKTGTYPDDVESVRWIRFVKGAPTDDGVAPLAGHDAPGDYSHLGQSGWETITGESITDIAQVPASLPTDYSMEQARPNPFNPSTTLELALPEAAELTVTVYNSLGREVARLASGSYPAGRHTLVWNAEQAASGLYLVHAEVPGKLNAVQKLMLVR